MNYVPRMCISIKFIFGTENVFFVFLFYNESGWRFFFSKIRRTTPQKSDTHTSHRTLLNDQLTRYISLIKHFYWHWVKFKSVRIEFISRIKIITKNKKMVLFVSLCVCQTFLILSQQCFLQVLLVQMYWMGLASDESSIGRVIAPFSFDLFSFGYLLKRSTWKRLRSVPCSYIRLQFV